MAFLQQLRIYCTPLTCNQRAELTRYWLTLPTCISPILDVVATTTPQEEIHLCLMHKSLSFLVTIKEELTSLGFNTANNFISVGWALFSLLLIMYLHIPLTPSSIDSMFARIRPYLLIYIIVDHTLDNDKTDCKEFKESFYNTIICKPITSQNKLIIYSCNLLKEIMALSPLSLPYIIKAASVAFESVELQSNPPDALSLCYTKGAVSTLAGCSLMSNGIIYEGTDILGSLGQLFDDIVDVEEDK